MTFFQTEAPITSLSAIAHALGGDVVRDSVMAPGPGHSARDRSMKVALSPTAPEGFHVMSFATDDWSACKDYVRARLGWPAFQARPLRRSDSAIRSPRTSPTSDVRKAPYRDVGDMKRKIEAAREIWSTAQDPRDSVVTTYLASRGIHLPAVVENEAIRFHPSCPWRDADGKLIRVPAMIGVMRSIETEQVVAVHRTRLSADGRKLDRRMLGPTAGAAIMLYPFSAIGAGITIAEGIETALSGWEIGWSNVWALGSAGAIASFPVLAGVQSLVALCENDDANRRAVNSVAERYDAADREVLLVHPACGNDLNDTIREVPAWK